MNHLLLFINLLLLPFGKTDELPQFKGGTNALSNFLTQYVVYPEYSRQNCISGTVQVSFNINKAGKVYHVKVYKGLGIDLDDEAMRLIKLTSGKWLLPANYITDANLIVPIVFHSDDGRCGAVDRNEMGAAIAAYKAHEGLVNAVTNYYTNKYLGKADSSKEQLIIALKEQLGFDEAFTNRVLAQAMHKLKEGDNEGACADWLFIKNIGSDKADKWLAKYCK